MGACQSENYVNAHSGVFQHQLSGWYPANCAIAPGTDVQASYGNRWHDAKVIGMVDDTRVRIQYKKFNYLPTVALELIRVRPKDLAKSKVEAVSAKAQRSSTRTHLAKRASTRSVKHAVPPTQSTQSAKRASTRTQSACGMENVYSLNSLRRLFDFPDERMHSIAKDEKRVSMSLMGDKGMEVPTYYY